MNRDTSKNKYFLAIAKEGAEYMFSKKIMIAVPEKSAGFLRDALNRSKKYLKPGEVWHIFENDYYYNDYINFKISQCRRDGSFNIKCLYH